MKVTCPHCNGTGKVEFKIELPTTLTKRQAQLYRAIKARPYAYGGNELAEILYSDDPNGGPLNPLATVHTVICHTNRRLKVVGERICANRRGIGATYQVVKLNVV